MKKNCLIKFYKNFFKKFYSFINYSEYTLIYHINFHTAFYCLFNIKQKNFELENIYK